MGDGRIFLKSHRHASFNKDLSNEPNFDQIHLAGQYGTFNVTIRCESVSESAFGASKACQIFKKISVLKV
jgi:hypothetical protein